GNIVKATVFLQGDSDAAANQRHEEGFSQLWPLYNDPLGVSGSIHFFEGKKAMKSGKLPHNHQLPSARPVPSRWYNESGGKIEEGNLSLLS
ncbi:hypothetical protein NFI96_013579, partial [Prochilodus magdalenae]